VPALLVAKLVVLEAVRRRLAVAAAGLTLAGIAFTAWGFTKLAGQLGASSLQLAGAVSGIVIFMAFMFVTVLALAAALIGATALGTELENGTLLSILPRPLRRVDLLAGKWLGAFGVVALYATGAVALEAAIVKVTTGYSAPQPLLAMSFIFALVALTVTCAMALSVRMAR